MKSRDADRRKPDSTPQIITCSDLDAAIALYAQRGFRLDMTMPADAPRIAIVSKDGEVVQLTFDESVSVAGVAVDDGGEPELLIARTEDSVWSRGRAGMEYRDLIPGRLGGRFIASHIRIPNGGPVADAVHYHKLGFQLIYCRRGWVRVVYEDQGPPFVMREGDCVLQPPEIRHRVLESSSGLEVIELASPAEHETWHDYALSLPTGDLCPDRLFGGQRFVHHIAGEARWQRGIGFEYRDLGLRDATGNYATGRVLRLAASELIPIHKEEDEVRFLAILSGSTRLSKQGGSVQRLEAGDACTVLSGSYVIESPSSAEILDVVLRAR